MFFFFSFLKENQKIIIFSDVEELIETGLFPPVCGNIFLFLPTLTIYVMPLFIALGSFTEKVQFA